MSARLKENRNRNSNLLSPAQKYEKKQLPLCNVTFDNDNLQSPKTTLKKFNEDIGTDDQPVGLRSSKKRKHVSKNEEQDLELGVKKQKFGNHEEEDVQKNQFVTGTQEIKEDKDHENDLFDTQGSPESTKSQKMKVQNEEEVLMRQDVQKKTLQRFVNIGTKYSEFLERKISAGVPSGSSTSVDTSETRDREDITKMLNYFEGKLRPYQTEGVIWLTVLFENCINGILADEMGLGKTIQIIALFAHLYERRVVGPFLIVAPLSTLGNWEAEFKRFAPKIPVVRFQGSELERKMQIKQIQGKFTIDGRVVKPVVICTYQVPLIEENFLSRYTWQYIVVDEGHRIKNPESRLSRELRSLKSVNRTLLTGTPLQNDIRELWALFNFLMPELFRDIEGFSSLLELEDMKDTNKLLENEAENKIISTIHKVLAPFTLRREKKFVLKDLVPKKEITVYCPLSEMQKYIYRAILQKDYDKLRMGRPAEEESSEGRRCRNKKVEYNESVIFGEGESEMKTRKLLRKSTKSNTFCSNKNVPFDCPDCPYICRITMQNTVMMLKKAVNHPYLIWTPIDPNAKSRQMFVSEDLIKHSGKLLVLEALLPKLKKMGHKVLIFSTMVMFMDMIEEMLLLRKYEFRRLDGSVDYTSRNNSIGDFMNDDKIFLFLLSTRAGGLGLNLTAADTVIFMDRDWNPMADLQAQDRCHRIGQTKPVVIYSLITKGTIDEIIEARGEMKKRLGKIVIQEGKFKTLSKNFDDDELKELEDLLKSEESSIKIRANGQIFTNNELNKILDRSDLIQQMKENQDKHDQN